MDFHYRITLANYRCYGTKNAAQFELRPGYIAFLGPNNSGKSTLLRFFYEWRGLLERLREPSTLMQFIQKLPFQFGPANGVEDAQEVYCDRTETPLAMDFEFMGVQEENALSQVKIKIDRNGNAGVELFRGKQRVPITDAVLKAGNALHWKSGEELRLAKLNLLEDFIYITTRILYIPPYRNAINHGESQSYYDLSLGTAFVAQWDQWQNGGNKLHAQQVLRVVRDIARVFGFGELQITPSQDRRTFQISVDGRPYRLREQGAGLAQFIIALGNVATKRPSFVCIDEPELNLHPVLQADFLESLGSYSEHGVIFATHSLGLARASADIIYSCHKNGDGQSSVKYFENVTNPAGFLAEMGFAGYRDIGYSTVLCVEGRTDTKPVRSILRKLGKEHLTVVLPLHGSNMIQKDRQHELAEIRRLADKVYVLVDSERKTENEGLVPHIAAFCSDCRSVGIDVHVTDRRALENYFPDHAIKTSLGSAYEALTPFELLKESNKPWSKSDNWKIANQMTMEDLRDTDLGEWLTQI